MEAPGPAPAIAMSYAVQLYIEHGYMGEKRADQAPAHFWSSSQSCRGNSFFSESSLREGSNPIKIM